MTNRAAVYLLPFLAAVGTANAGQIGLRFTGTLFNQAQVFGETLSAAETIQGTLIYESTAASSSSGADCTQCAAYGQSPPARFFISLGPLVVRYNEFLVTVLDDSPGLLPGSTEDVLAFGPDPSGSIAGVFVNGIQDPDGQIDVALTSPVDPFSSTSLPAAVNPTDFPLSNVLVSDGTSILFSQIAFGALQTFEVLEGDFNLDEAVSLADYTEWSQQYGLAVTLTADGNGDGQVDAADYTLWRDAYESTTTAVPEPQALLGVCLGAMAMAVGDRRS